jgi:cell division protein FtsB
LAYEGERADVLMLDQLEAILRHVADELAGWRARALKAEGELKEVGGKAGGGKPDLETRTRVADLEQENKVLRQRIEAAQLGVHDLLSRLAFLEEQARDSRGDGVEGRRGGAAGGVRGAEGMGEGAAVGSSGGTGGPVGTP